MEASLLENRNSLAKESQRVVYLIKLHIGRQSPQARTALAGFFSLTSLWEITGDLVSIIGKEELKVKVPLNEFTEMARTLGCEVDLSKRQVIARGDESYVRLIVYSAARALFRSPYKAFEFRSLVKNMPFLEALYWAAMFRRYMAAHGVRGLRRPTEAFKLAYGLD